MSNVSPVSFTIPVDAIEGAGNLSWTVSELVNLASTQEFGIGQIEKVSPGEPNPFLWRQARGRRVRGTPEVRTGPS